MLKRIVLDAIKERLAFQPAVVLLGPRQVGKTTLARTLAAEFPGALFLDLEQESDRARLVNPQLFFSQYRDRLVILDEVQVMPELFSALRPEIDAARKPGRFLLLGSASGKLLNQSSESLAGRVSYLELAPLLLAEIGPEEDAWKKLWLRGGFPTSFTAPTDRVSGLWRADFLKTFLTRDIPQAGVSIPAETLRNFWRMCAHLNGQLFNASQIGQALGGMSHATIGRYLDLFVDTMMLRRLEPFFVNLGKRLVKSPKVYVRDSGLLHALLNIQGFDDLLGHPVVGHSWEGFVIEQISSAMPAFSDINFYRTAAGAELDAVVTTGDRRIGYEIKFSQSPKPSKGFWNACEDIGVECAYVVAPVTDPYPLAENVQVIPPRLLFRL
jgi:predicted AAA+ superfamily ATPase